MLGQQSTVVRTWFCSQPAWFGRILWQMTYFSIDSVSFYANWGLESYFKD